VLVWLSIWREMQIVCIWSSWCHCHPKTSLSIASFKYRLVLPFRYRLTQVCLEKRLLNWYSSIVVFGGSRHCFSVFTAACLFTNRKNCYGWTVMKSDAPSLLWRCLLGSRKGIQPVKIYVVGWSCLQWGADSHMAQLMPLPLNDSCFKLVLSFWYRLTWVVTDKGPLNGCVPCVFHEIWRLGRLCTNEKLSKLWKVSICN